MSLTRANLINQSDQILSSPIIENSIVLQTISTNPTLTLTFSPAPTSARVVNFPDPGIPSDTICYLNAVQTLTNKTLTGVILTAPTITDFTNAQHTHLNTVNGGQFAHANLLLRNADDHTQYALLAGRAGGQILTGGTNASDPLTLRSTTDATKGGITVDQDNINMGSGFNINFSGGGQPLGLPNVPIGASAAASKAYVDAQIAALTGGAGVWREDLLSAFQLDNANKAIDQGVAFYWNATPVNGDTFTLTDGTNTETYTYAAVSSAFNPVTGGTATTAMNNLAANINTNSGFWAVLVVTDLQSINATGVVMVITRKVPGATVLDRIYGVTFTSNIGQYVNYGGQLDYRSSLVVNLPTTDPGSATFGINRLTAALIPDEAHVVRAEDDIYLWNSDAGMWQLSGGSIVTATSGPGGGVVGQATYDSNKGLEVTAGVVGVTVDGSSISFNGFGELQVAGGAVPFGTSAPAAAGVAGKVSGDESSGIHIIPSGPTEGAVQVKIDGTTMMFDGFGNLKATPTAASPTGTISKNIPFTSNIPGVSPPSNGVVASDIPTLNYPHGSTTGQLFDITVPDDYSVGNLLILGVYEMFAGTGNVRYQTQAKIVHKSGSIDTATYPATPVTLVAPPTTPTRTTLMTINNGTFTAGDVIQVYISRLGSDVLDTNVNNWVMIAFEYSYTGQVSTRAAVQDIEVYSDSVVAPPATPAFLDSDIPVLSFPTTPDSAEVAIFIVPDNWDGVSDFQIRVDYAMSSAFSGDEVRLETSGNLVDVVNNVITALPVVDFDLYVSNDTNPHRTVVIRSIPAASLTTGSVVELVIRRVTSGLPGTNHPGSFLLINTTASIGLVPTGGFTQTQIEEKYLNPGTFGNITGSVSGTTLYPTFGVTANDFMGLYTLAGTGAGTLNIAFQGRLASFQTQVVNAIAGFQLVSGSAGNVTVTLNIYFEGQGSAVYTQVITPTSTYTEYTVNTSLITPQPTIDKRFYVEVAGVFTGACSFGVSTPFARVE